MGLPPCVGQGFSPACNDGVAGFSPACNDGVAGFSPACNDRGAGLQPCATTGIPLATSCCVFLPRPARLRAFDYRGLHRYHVRAGTWDRARHFADARSVLLVSDRLLHHAMGHDFDVLAYCFMWDHVHALVAGRTQAADLRTFVATWKQQSGFLFARMTRKRLWQPGYFERVLRDDETSLAVARYIMENPIRAGRATRVGEYLHAWCVWGNDLRG